MRESRTYGSVRGACSNGRPYRDPINGQQFVSALAFARLSRNVNQHPKWNPLKSETSLCDWRAVCLQVGVPVGADWDPTKLSFSVLYQAPVQNRRGVPVRC